MNDPARRLATYEDVLAAPQEVVAELIHGSLITSPRPASPHAHAASVLGMDLGSPFQRGRGGPGGWWILDEPELHLGSHVLVPDLAGWRTERMPRIPKVPHFELAPDWVCEVLSPSTEAIDRADKMPIYAEAGVAWAWLLNPLLRTLEVLRLHEGDHKGSWVLHASLRGDGPARVEPFEAVELVLKDLWLEETEEGP